MKGKKEQPSVIVKKDNGDKKTKNLTLTGLFDKLAEDTEEMKMFVENISTDVKNMSFDLLNVLDYFQKTEINEKSRKDETLSKDISSNPLEKLNKKNKSIDWENHLFKIESLLDALRGKITNGGSSAQTKIDTSNIESLSKSVGTLGTTLSRKTNNNLRQFLHILKEFCSKKNQKSVAAMADSFKPLSDSFENISKGAKNISEELRQTMTGILLFSIMLTSPLFKAATESLTQFFAAIHSRGKSIQINKTKNISTDYKWIFISIAVGITAIVGSFILLKSVDWKSVVALLSFLGAISFFVFMSTKNIKGSNMSIMSNNNTTKNISKNNNNLGSGLGMIAIGLGVLVLAIYAIKDIDWASALKLVLFLGTIQTIIVASNIIVGKRGNNSGGGNGMLGFALGFGILLLAIAAGQDLFNQEPIMKSFMGMNIPVNPVYGIIGFIALMGFVIAYSNKNGNNAIQKFSIGVAILVITVYSWNKIVSSNPEILKNAFSLALIVFVFGSIFKFISGKKTTQFGEGLRNIDSDQIKDFTKSFVIIGVAGASIMLLLSMIKDNVASIALKAATMVGVIFTISFIISKIPKMMKGINRKQLQKDLTLIGIVSAAGLAIVTTLSLLNSSVSDLVVRASVMMGVISLVALSTIKIGEIAEKHKNAFIFGSILMASVSAIMLISTLAMKPLIETEVSGNLWDKAKVMWATIGIITAGIAALGGLCMIPGFNIAIAIGAGVMLAVSTIMLIASKSLVNISKISVKDMENKTQIFSNSVSKIMKIFKDFSLKDIVKMGAASIAAIPIFSNALKMAQTMKLVGEITTDKNQMNNFTNMIIDFITTFSENLKNASKKGILKMKSSTKDLLGIVDIAKSFVDVLISIANGKIAIYTVKDGQPYLDRYEKFDIDSLSTTAGKKLGQLMIGFVNAMQSLEITRKQKRQLHGIGSSMGEITPLLDSISNFMSNVEAINSLSNNKLMNSINTNLPSFIESLMGSVKKIDKLDTNSSTLQQLSQFCKNMGETKWDKITRGTENAAKGVDKLVTSINRLKLKNAIELRNTINAFTNIDRLKKVDEQLTKLVKIIEGISNAQSTIESLTRTNQQKLEDTKEQIKQTKEVIKNASSSGMSEQWFATNIIPMINRIYNAINDVADGIDVTVVNTVKTQEQINI